MYRVDNTYLEDEVRDGFFVSSKIKRAWANGLVLLAELDKICEKNNIKYSLDWGTLLGAVRHRGIIPWDDDFDIVMHRNELDRFMDVCKKEYADSFNFITFENNDYHWKFIVSFANTERMCFKPEYLKTHYNFPYISSIDIFVLDNVSDDYEQEKKRNERVKRLVNIDSGIEHGDFTDSQLKILFSTIERDFGEEISVKESQTDIRRKLCSLVLKELKRFNSINTKKVAQIVPWGMNEKQLYPREYFERTMKVPFEELELSVSIYADELLKIKYGDYQRIVRGTFGHGYPFFESQRKGLDTDMDIYPHYKYLPNAKYEYNDASSLKVITKEYLSHLSEIVGLMKSASDDEIILICEDEQAMAIDYGTLVEEANGEGGPLISNLEKYCELLFNYCEGACALTDIEKVVTSIADSATSQILSKKEILFVCYKNKQDSLFSNIMNDAINNLDANTDIRVMALPYGYKEYDGSINELLRGEFICPDKVKVANFEDYDFSLHCPDKVYIQNPYDQYNTTTGTLPELYIANIRQYTKELVYVPYLEVADFTKEDENQNYNIKDYVCSPGVALSDLVILGSKEMKERYIEILVDWAGKETEEVWKDKISVVDGEKNECTLKNLKRLLVYCSASSLLYGKENYLKKIKDNLRIIQESGMNTTLVLSPQFIKIVSEHADYLLGEWEDIMRGIEQSENVVIDESDNIEYLTSESSAYYGEPSVYATKMMLKHKPVMIRSVYNNN